MEHTISPGQRDLNLIFFFFYPTIPDKSIVGRAMTGGENEGLFIVKVSETGRNQ